MNHASETYCPRCNAPLTLSVRPGHAYEPCSACGMRFIDGGATHETCGAPFAMHIWKCPVARPIQRILCPLCGSPRHRKDKRLSFIACSWRQWAMATGRLPRDAEPDAEVPDQLDPTLMSEYQRWLQKHSNLEAGSVPAERIFRQRMRERHTLLPN